MDTGSSDIRSARLQRVVEEFRRNTETYRAASRASNVVTSLTQNPQPLPPTQRVETQGSSSTQLQVEILSGVTESVNESVLNPSQSNLGQHDKKSESVARNEAEALKDYMDAAFLEKKRASENREWCKPIADDIKHSTVRTFLQNFYDDKTLPISHCVVCYQKMAPDDLSLARWRRWHCKVDELSSVFADIFQCEQCFPRAEGSKVSVCSSCTASLGRGMVPKECLVNNIYIGCEHKYPEVLKNLSPAEEFLISLNKAYGFFARFRKDKTNATGTYYRRHVKGHITVFPGDVENIVTTILPHSLLDRLDEIHVSWSGAEKPKPRDVTKLLKVRKRNVLESLEWLQKNNPLYQHIQIVPRNITQLRYMQGTDVPELLYNSMTHNEPTVQEKVSEDVIGVLDPAKSATGEQDVITDCQAVLAELRTSSGILPTVLDNDTKHSIEDQLNSSNDDIEMDFDDSDSELLDSEDILQTITATAMLNVDESHNLNKSISQLEFIEQAMTQTPYIRVQRGSEFASSMDPDYFPKTFPTLFPFGRGGPLQVNREKCTHWNGEDDNSEAINTENLVCDICVRDESSASNHSLKKWAKFALNRHGGQFACHPVFCFLVFNMLLRINVNRICAAKMSSVNFTRTQQIFHKLTPARLEAAKQELLDDKRTTDPLVKALLRDLSLFFRAQPLSNESRIDMRKKVYSLCIYDCMQNIWFTINPNDVDNPVKIRLAVHRDHSLEEATKVLKTYLENSDLRQRLFDSSIMDPVSSSIFFEREVQMFFRDIVKVGGESIFGRVTRYFSAVETNMRGMLHLHGFLWLKGNIQIPNLASEMADSNKDSASDNLLSYREEVCHWLDQVVCNTLDTESSRNCPKEHLREAPQQIWQDEEYLDSHFEEEANFVAKHRQIHNHTPTCVKYSYKKLLPEAKSSSKQSKDVEHPCRFKAPWPLEEETHFTNEGLLRHRRNHPMVNSYNQALSIALRHNHDITMICSKSHSLSMLFYLTNYATKLETPMWKRLAIAQEYKMLVDEQSSSSANPLHAGGVDSTKNQQVYTPQSIKFLRKVANRISTERSLSAVEVCHHLLEHSSEYHNVRQWSWVSLGSLYWAIFRSWRFFEHEARRHTMVESEEPVVHLIPSGRKLSVLTAYKHRGPILRSLCLYDYVSQVQVMRDSTKYRKRKAVPFSADGGEDCKGWSQILRNSENLAIPVIDGTFGNIFDNQESSKHHCW
jgi:hypothetical protein